MIDKLQKCPKCNQEGMLDIFYYPQNPEKPCIVAVCLSNDCLYEGKFYL